MFGLGTPELLIILALVLVLFGAAKIPDLARSLGKGVSEFRKAQREGKEELGGGNAGDGDTCPVCKAKIAQGVRFCPQCGRAVQNSGICAKCQARVGPADKFCPQCGQSL